VRKTLAGLLGTVLALFGAVAVDCLPGAYGQINEMKRDPAWERLEAALPALDAALIDAAIARYGESKDKALTVRVTRYGKYLANKVNWWNRDLKFRLVVLGDAKTARAISLPGGSLLVTEKLARALANDEELAAVLSHQLGHAATRQLLGRLKENAQVVAWLQRRDRDAANHVLDHLFSIEYDNDDEQYADDAAIRCLYQAGDDPKALAVLPDLLRRVHATEMLATHPPYQDRVAILDRDAGRILHQDRWGLQYALAAVPRIAAKFGGIVSDDASKRMSRIGRRLVVNASDRMGADPISFTLLADTGTVNAFAMPTGQIFITRGLLQRLKTDGELAAVLSHEIVHTFMDDLTRMEKRDGESREAWIGRMEIVAVGVKHDQNEESYALLDGTMLMMDSGYDPRVMLQVMKALDKASAFAQFHPASPRREEFIEKTIRKRYPGGVPSGLKR
jgi:predicted Zn-dependent protease